jgi:hypothetical protein
MASEVQSIRWDDGTIAAFVIPCATGVETDEVHRKVIAALAAAYPGYTIIDHRENPPAVWAFDADDSELVLMQPDYGHTVLRSALTRALGEL